MLRFTLPFSQADADNASQIAATLQGIVVAVAATGEALVHDSGRWQSPRYGCSSSQSGAGCGGRANRDLEWLVPGAGKRHRLAENGAGAAPAFSPDFKSVRGGPQVCGRKTGNGPAEGTEAATCPAGTPALVRVERQHVPDEVVGQRLDVGGQQASQLRAARHAVLLAAAGLEVVAGLRALDPPEVVAGRGGGDQPHLARFVAQSS